jgi:hypothetical protein
VISTLIGLKVKSVSSYREVKSPIKVIGYMAYSVTCHCQRENYEEGDKGNEFQV